MVLLKALCAANYGFIIKSKMRSYGFLLKKLFHKTPKHSHQMFPCVTKCSLRDINDQTIVCDIDRCLLRSKSFFPYFMLVAFEGGSFIRALILLLSSPSMLLLDYNTCITLMTFISFCGLNVKSMHRVGKAVLPKFFLENLHFQAFKVLKLSGKKIVITGVPKVMVDWFLREYLDVDEVLGTELHTFGKYFTGFVCGDGVVVKHIKLKEFFGDEMPHLGIGSCVNDHPFMSMCKKAYLVNKQHTLNCPIITPRVSYSKPLVFHDGRLAFLPTPVSTLLMFLYLPLGVTLAILRLMVGTMLPRKLSMVLGRCMGVTITLKGACPTSKPGKGILYVCTHRTLLDPVFLSTVLGQPLTAVTYSLSKISELLAPIRTVRLTRNKKRDGDTIRHLLSQGDLVVCPEGTTCREPYLLRFSSLFAELTEDIVPVAISANMSMFYGTSTLSGSKCLDPLFFLMNPRPRYEIEVLEKVPREMTCAGGMSSFEVANLIQRKLGDALGYECTMLTRKDKYMMLSGNEGLVST